MKLRRQLGLAQLALLSTACSLRPWTPSVSVAYFTEDVPATRAVRLPRGSDLASAWMLPASDPWAAWSKPTIFGAVDAMGGHAELPDVRSLEAVSSAERAASHLARVGLPADTLWILDLRGAASCAFAARLTRESREPVSPIVTFNNWPSDASVVPADETLAGLLSFTPRLPPEGVRATHPMLLLDAWRLAYRFDDPGAGVYDNRYMLAPTDVPSAAQLHARGITRVVYVVEDLDDAEVEEDDLHASFRAWQAAGLGIHMVDLAFLAQVPAPVGGQWPVDWALRLSPRTHWVRERYTLVDDPVFYMRARAGFGLAFGRPRIYPGWRAGGYGYGYGGFGGSRGGGG
ncbi:MAG: hypothetical protein R3B36_17915 [Polyangiaceae bacterium]